MKLHHRNHTEREIHICTSVYVVSACARWRAWLESWKVHQISVCFRGSAFAKWKWFSLHGLKQLKHFWPNIRFEIVHFLLHFLRSQFSYILSFSGSREIVVLMSRNEREMLRNEEHLSFKTSRPKVLVVVKVNEGILIVIVNLVRVSLFLR